MLEARQESAVLSGGTPQCPICGARSKSSAGGRGHYFPSARSHRDIADNADDKGWYALAAAPLRPWLQPVFKYEWFNRPGVAPAGTLKNRAWTLGANVFPWGRTARLTLEYVSRKVGEPGQRRSLGLAQAQVIF